MDNQRGLLLGWTYSLYQENSEDELRQPLMMDMELEETRLKAQEELAMRDLEIAQLKSLLCRAIIGRDEAQENCQIACFQKALPQKQKRNQSAPRTGISDIDDDPTRRTEPPHNGLSSSDESIGSPPPRIPAASPPDPKLPVVPNRPLPEKGELLQAVMRAGPLLQTLLLGGGPLPQWRHSPPPIDTYQIPPPPLMVLPSPPPAASFYQESLHSNMRSM
ncbi:hypothetical protein OROHE_021335 [Orobanche hederae]